MQRSGMRHRRYTFQRFVPMQRMALQKVNHIEALPKAKIIDTVSYSSLLPGKEYTVTGTLMNKKIGEPVLIDGKKVTAGTTFVAENGRRKCRSCIRV